MVWATALVADFSHSLETGRHGRVQRAQRHEEGKNELNPGFLTETGNSEGCYLIYDTFPTVFAGRRLPGEEEEVQAPEGQTKPHQEDGQRLWPQMLKERATGQQWESIDVSASVQMCGSLPFVSWAVLLSGHSIDNACIINY